MKITVKKAEKQRFSLSIPNWLLLNPLSAWILKCGIRIKSDEGRTVRLNITPKQMRNIRRCIKEMKGLHNDWCLVDIVDGEDSLKVRM